MYFPILFQLPEHFHYDKTDLNPFFYRPLSKPITHWFLAVENAVTNLSYSRRKHSQKTLPIGTLLLKRNFSHVHFSDKLKLFRIGPYKILDRLSDVTYEFLSPDGSTIHVQRNHSIPCYPKEPFLYPHLRNFMPFSDSTQFEIPNTSNCDICDSSPFNSDQSQSDEDSLTQPIIPSTTSSYNLKTPSSNDSSPVKLHVNSHSKKIFKTHQTDMSNDRLRHPSQNQSILPPLPIDKTRKTHCNLRRQPKMDYRLFIPTSKLLNQ